MFDKIKELWENKGFDILVGLSIAFIIIFGLYRLFSNKSGSYSDKFYYNPNENINYENINYEIKKKIPKESKGEVECRRVLNKIFNRPFNKNRPSFLNNPVTGGNYNLELDCYDPQLKLAVEYDGEAHAKYIPYFHKNKEAFYNQKYRDYIKDMMCKNNGITLIRVPHTVKVQNIESYLINELRRHHFNI
jgi:hypothetical protein